MRVLIIHHEAEYFAGAEVLLGYFLGQIQASACQVTVAAVQGSKAAAVIPQGIDTVWIDPNARFSPRQFLKQTRQTCRLARQGGFDGIHGWAARDWELAAATARMTGIPAVGTLHDHPRANFISAKRQKLMRWAALWGLARVICISRAVRAAALAAGYQDRKLIVAHNGLPFSSKTVPERRAPGPVRIAFLGAVSERKGLRGMFEMMARLAEMQAPPWQLFIAGAPLEASGAELQRSLQERYGKERWSERVHWCGWVERPLDFLAGMDLLVCPSAEFEPFGLVICEAAGLGVPVLAAKVGGPEEIIIDGETGWLFEPGDWAGAARRLAEAVADEPLRRIIGERGRRHVREQFNIEKMVAQYLGVYSTLGAV